MQVGLRPLDRIEQPREGGMYLHPQIEVDQRVERERRVADPCVAVVVVSAAADPLRKRRRRRRDDRPGRDIRQHAQGQGADDVVPVAFDAPSCEPAPPVVGRVGQPPLRPLAAREGDRLVLSRSQHERRDRVLPELERPRDLRLVVMQVARVERVERERLVAGGHPHGVAQRCDCDVDLRLPCSGPQRHAPAHRHGAGHPLDAPDELEPGQEPAVVEHDRVGDPDGAACGQERRLEDVRVARVSPLDAVLDLRLELEGPAAVGVEEPGEDRRRIEARQREPVDRAVARHERESPAVSDRGVILDRRVAVDPLHAPDYRWPK